MTLVPGESYLHLELVLNPFELRFAYKIDENGNGTLEEDELERQKSALTWRLLNCLRLRIGGKRLDPEIAGIESGAVDHHLTLRAHYPVDGRTKPIVLAPGLTAVTSRAHVTQVTYAYSGQSQKAQLDVQSQEAVFSAFEATGLLRALTYVMNNYWFTNYRAG